MFKGQTGYSVGGGSGSRGMTDLPVPQPQDTSLGIELGFLGPSCEPLLTGSLLEAAGGLLRKSLQAVA